ncbi:hypothetical protein, partial [Mesorhizobium sp. M1E.F.Ca.ET.063.01.1.1]|uniref:hypothetical protein n=1 Tax=Mesorhizobium sp. M1E.F.Ca.ET.063.01.1.1 TaxID=2496750 RepID=UPI001AECC95A
HRAQESRPLSAFFVPAGGIESPAESRVLCEERYEESTRLCLNLCSQIVGPNNIQGPNCHDLHTNNRQMQAIGV